MKLKNLFPEHHLVTPSPKSIGPILALETSTMTGSVALLLPQTLTRREHILSLPIANPTSQTILPAVQALLQQAELRLEDCAAIAFGAGPGGFTGVRLATGVAQGLGFAAQKPLLPVCSLIACAELERRQPQQHPERLRSMVVLDARMQQVYWGMLEWQGERWVWTMPAAVDHPEAVPQPTQPFVLVAAAQVSLPVQLAQAAVRVVQVELQAQAVAQVGLQLLLAGAGCTAQQAQPFYVRDRVALTLAERGVGLTAPSGAS